MPKMRARTVARRTNYYRGTGGAKAGIAPGIPALRLADDDPEGVDCQECGVRVKRLVSGRPRAHAAGGYKPNTRAGRYHCAGSGTDG